MFELELSDKQVESLAESVARLNCWEGSVRSGKTFISLWRVCHFIADGPEGDGMIVGVSRETIQRNVLPEICKFLHIPLPSPKAPNMSIFGRTIHLVGANDERAQRKIQGSTLVFGYIDEATLIPEGFFKMLLSRLSKPGAKLFMTTNPDSPFHWLKEQYLDNSELDLKRWQFRLEDNPSLETEYIEALKREYSGLWYQRYIEGKWVLAEGCIYDFFNEADHVIERAPTLATHYIAGIDYGTSNPFACVLIGINPQVHPNYWVESEYYYDSRRELRQKTDTEYAEDVVRFLAGKNVQAVYLDPSAASFKAELTNSTNLVVCDCDNDVMNGIRFTSQLLANGALKIVRECRNLIREMGTYVWDETASRRGEDKPKKEHDHSCDALRYAVFSHFGQGASHLRPEDLEDMWRKSQQNGPSLPPMFQGSGW